MRPIPLTMRAEIAKDPFMRLCIYDGCGGSPEWEHAMIYRNKRVNEIWAIVPVCAYHHRGAGLMKSYNQHRALQRATDEDLAKYSKANWKQLRTHLESLYGSTK